MSTTNEPFVIICNEPPCQPGSTRALRLDYRRDSLDRNIALHLPTFIKRLGHLSPRLLDLLEMAAYLYAADRYSSRGPRDAVEYQAWSRRFEFHLKVRDFDFWVQDDTQDLLTKALLFMTGDRSYDFNFYPGHITPPTSLFDSEEFTANVLSEPAAVTLFSGGLDSLAGTLNLLDSNQNLKVFLISHQSQPGTKRTQKKLVEALSEKYGDRVHHYPFECHLRRARAREETQRTRFFLYSTIALCVATAFQLSTIHVFENGVTSINPSRRQDLVNARASRTTHPKTLAYMADLFSHLKESALQIVAPFVEKTKSDIITEILRSGFPELISSTVSCSRTFKNLGNATHCGECFQCFDRRIASYTSRAEGFDHRGLYARDTIIEPFSSKESTTTAVDYLRQAVDFANLSLDEFYDRQLDMLADLVDHLPFSGSELDKAERIWKVFQKHGNDVLKGLHQMRLLHEDLRQPLPSSCLLGLVADREYLRPAVMRLIDSVKDILQPAVPEMFSKHKPKNEHDLNQKISALLRTHRDDLRSEHPTVSFACAKVVPDHQLKDMDLLIESKYIREKTTPSKATDGIASDLTKYPQHFHILFVVYDPAHAIPSDQEFTGDIQGKGRCTVCIIR